MSKDEPSEPMRIVEPPGPLLTYQHPVMTMDRAIPVLRTWQGLPNYWAASLVGPPDAVILTVSMVERG